MSSLTCLVISPVGDARSDTRRRADQVFKHIIEPVVSGLGFAAKRADQMRLPGVITGPLLAAVADSDLVVADLTDHDANVFYELAIRHAAQRPVVQLIDAAQRPPFDLDHMRTIYIDVHDLDSAEEARQQLRDQVEGAGTTATVDTPIASARSLKTLWEGQEPAAPILAEALNEIRAFEQERIRGEWSSAEDRGGDVARPPNLLNSTGQLSFPGQPLFPGRPLFSGLPSAFEPDAAAADAAEPSSDNHNDRNGRNHTDRAAHNHDGKPASSAKARKARKRHS